MPTALPAMQRVVHRLSALLFVVAAVWLSPTGPVGAAEVVSLKRHAKVDPNTVTVSGVSSGGYFANQFEVAYAAVVKGAGIVAAGPYDCARQVPALLQFALYADITTAMTLCSDNDKYVNWMKPYYPAAPSAKTAVEFTYDRYAAGVIDNPKNIAKHRVWLFSGAKDRIVPRGVTESLEKYYKLLGVPDTDVKLYPGKGANHGMPVKDAVDDAHRAVPCGEHTSPYIIKCSFEAAELLLKHLYPGLAEAPATPSQDNLVFFDQTRFFNRSDIRAGLADVGVAYVPARCQNGTALPQACKLHVAFHGCSQTTEQIGDSFYWGANYNRWAEANGIVVLYPQAKAWTWSWPTYDPLGITANPLGCWDFWGYTGQNYDRKSGTQMLAVRSMIGTILGEQ